MLLLGLMLAIVGVGNCQFHEENSTKILDDKSIHDFVHTYPRSMILFYIPGSGPCEKLKPQFQKAAALMVDDGIPFAQLDSQTYKDAASLYGVTGYPSVVWFEDGQNKTKYEGGKTYDAIQLWVYEQINPGSKEVTGIAEVKEEIEKHDCVFFFFGQDPKDRTFRRYRDFSLTMSNAIFRHTFTSGAAKAAGVSEKIQVAVFKKFDKSPIVFDQKQLKIPELQAFVELNVLPRITEWTEEIQKRVFTQDRQAVILFSNGDQDLYNNYSKFAYNYPTEEYLLIINATPESQYWAILKQQFGIWDSKLNEGPQLLFVSKNATLRYLYRGKDFRAMNIEKFVYESKDGKTQRYFVSQEKASVYQGLQGFEFLTGETYVSNMLSSPKDWLVIYVDSRQREHVELLFVFNRVALRLQKNPNVAFAITDAYQNEYPDFDESLELVKIRLYKGQPGKKQFMKFNLKANKVQEDRIVNFIYDHTSYEWVGSKSDL